MYFSIYLNYLSYLLVLDCLVYGLLVYFFFSVGLNNYCWVFTRCFCQTFLLSLKLYLLDWELTFCYFYAGLIFSLVFGALVVKMAVSCRAVDARCLSWTQYLVYGFGLDIWRCRDFKISSLIKFKGEIQRRKECKWVSGISESASCSSLFFMWTWYYGVRCSSQFEFV